MMPFEISKSQFKARALEFFRAVESTGVPIVITDRGLPTLELRRHQPAISPLDKLTGSLLHYDRPTDPIGEEDWEVMHDPD